MSEAQRQALRTQLEASNVEFFFHHKQAQTATKAIGAVAVLFVVGGLISSVMTFVKSHETLAPLAGQDPSAPLATAMHGATTVGELRAALEREPWLLLGVYLFLAAVMGGLWLWSKRSVLPATIAALGVFIALNVGNAIYDPSTIVQGLLVKIAVTVMLVSGVKSALAARRIELAG